MNKKSQEELYRLLGENIKTSRIRQKVSQQDLAIKVDLSRTSIVNIEQGRQHPPIHLLYEIADCLQVNANDLLPKASEINVGIVLDSDKEKIEQNDLDVINSLIKDFQTTNTKP
ncbi:helix-turn-helix domain-containing protein [Larkinella bovis]|uniref:Helix-turn-helix domain-containing protein n=1 Tax=Larkinella bovis TaxID=683041 RepID=A0ABW0I9C6_9BACT